jgi:hypothetical protein
MKRIRMSRVGIAYAVLRGYQVAYRIRVERGTLMITGRHRVRDCTFIGPGIPVPQHPGFDTKIEGNHIVPPNEGISA